MLTLRRTVSGSTHQKPGTTDGADIAAEELDHRGLARGHDHERRDDQGEDHER